jgi:hypothetical protein
MREFACQSRVPSLLIGLQGVFRSSSPYSDATFITSNRGNKPSRRIEYPVATVLG